MKNGLARFDFFLNQFQALLDKAARQKNPALWLYQNNARTTLFMLEALAKIYTGLHNKKKFGKLKEHFKLLEDAIGQIDYYDAFAKEFAGNKKIPAPIIAYLQAQTREKIQSLNEILKEKEWLSEGNKQMMKTRKKLAEADWKKEKKEIKEIRSFYMQGIKEILNFVNQKNFRFGNVETDIHEFRRKLRWLSIYPQALRGCIQLSKSKVAPQKYLWKYLTKEITGSAYNVMPDAGDCNYFLLLEKNRFYALSWMIAELGKLKDNGLRAEVIKEAIMQTSGADARNALLQAYKLCGPGQMKVNQVLTAAADLCKIYCKEKNLENLLTGVAAVKK
jgi:hypothetical protein